MPQLSLQLDPTLKQSLEIPLADTGFRVIEAGAAVDAPVQLDGLAFTLAAGAKATVLAFNSTEDQDPAAILKPTKPNADPPLIALTPDHAWLKYEFLAQVRAAGGGTLSGVGLDIEGEKEAVFADYRRHARTDEAWTTLLGDAGRLRFAAQPEALTQLGAGEAVSYQLRGKLTAQIEVEWADLLTANVALLGNLVVTDTPLALRFQSGLSVAAHLKVTDDYLVAFCRAEGGQIRVSVKKARSRSAGVTGKLEVVAEFADSDSLQKALEATVAGLLGPADQLQKLLKRTSLSNLSKTEAEIIRRLGLADTLDDVDRLRKRVAELEGQVKDTVQRIAKAKLEVGFAYEYERISEESTLLRAVLREERAVAHHDDLLKGRLDELLTELRSEPKRVESYLHEKTTKRRRAWGFSLGIDVWKGLGKDRVETTNVERHDLQGRRKLSYAGLRGYDGKFGGESWSWVADLKADMPKFGQVGLEPSLREFELGLDLQMSRTKKKLRAKEVTPLLDLAVVWGALENDELAAVESELDDLADAKQEVTVNVELTFSHGALVRVLQRAAGGNQDDLARALALALPWTDAIEGRRAADRRQELYAPLWRRFLAEDFVHNLTRGELTNFVHSVLRNLPGGSGSAQSERFLAQTPNPGPTTFVGVVELHPNLPAACERFVEGLFLLDRAFQQGESHEVFPRAFRQLQGFWSQSFYLRAAGAYLLRSAGVDRDGIQQSLVVESDGEKRIVISSELTR